MSDNIRKKLLCKTGGKKRDVATKLVLGQGSIKRIGNQTGLVLCSMYYDPTLVMSKYRDMAAMLGDQLPYTRHYNPWLLYFKPTF